MRILSRSSAQSSAVCASGQKKGLFGISAQSQRARSTGPAADLHQRAAEGDARQDLLRDRAGRHPHRRLARRGAAAAARVAQAVFRVVGEVGVARPERVDDLRVVLRALVGVLDQERDRRSRRHLHAVLLVDAGQDPHLVGLPALRGEARLAGLAAVEIGLDLRFRQRNARRAAVDDAADCGPVALAPGGDTEKVAEAVVGHAVGVRELDRRFLVPPAKPVKWHWRERRRARSRGRPR